MAAPLLLIVPTRGRPGALEELAANIASTATHTDFLPVVDDDDPELEHYRDLDIHVRVVPRQRLGPTLNLVAGEAIAAGGHTTLAFMGDDHRPRTMGWDRLFLTELEDRGPGFVYGDDLLMGARMPTAIAISAPIIETLGWLYPPGLIHLNGDLAWLELGNAIGRLFYRPDVVIEHLHPAAGKAELDAGYEEANSETQVEADGVAYRRWRLEDFPLDVAKLEALLATAAPA